MVKVLQYTWSIVNDQHSEGGAESKIQLRITIVILFYINHSIDNYHS